MKFVSNQIQNTARGRLDAKYGTEYRFSLNAASSYLFPKVHNVELACVYLSMDKLTSETPFPESDRISVPSRTGYQCPKHLGTPSYHL
jgi:hypothetical protein